MQAWLRFRKSKFLQKAQLSSDLSCWTCPLDKALSKTSRCPIHRNTYNTEVLGVKVWWADNAVELIESVPKLVWLKFKGKRVRLVHCNWLDPCWHCDWLTPKSSSGFSRGSLPCFSRPKFSRGSTFTYRWRKNLDDLQAKDSIKETASKNVSHIQFPRVQWTLRVTFQFNLNPLCLLLQTTRSCLHGPRQYKCIFLVV